MTELLAVVASPWSWIGWTLLLFGVGPSMILLVIVRAYPNGHARRVELVNELVVVPYLKRPVWVASLIPLVLHDGMRARRVNHIETSTARGAAPVFAVMTPVFAVVFALGVSVSVSAFGFLILFDCIYLFSPPTSGSVTESAAESDRLFVVIITAVIFAAGAIAAIAVFLGRLHGRAREARRLRMLAEARRHRAPWALTE